MRHLTKNERLATIVPAYAQRQIWRAAVTSLRGHNTIWVHRNSAIFLPGRAIADDRIPDLGRIAQVNRRRDAGYRAGARGPEKVALELSIVVKLSAPAGRCARQP